MFPYNDFISYFQGCAVKLGDENLIVMPDYNEHEKVKLSPVFGSARESTRSVDYRELLSWNILGWPKLGWRLVKDTPQFFYKLGRSSVIKGLSHQNLSMVMPDDLQKIAKALNLTVPQRDSLQLVECVLTRDFSSYDEALDRLESGEGMAFPVSEDLLLSVSIEEDKMADVYWKTTRIGEVGMNRKLIVTDADFTPEEVLP